MRPHAYALFAVAAAPVAVWSAFELVARAAFGLSDGVPATLILGTCAAGTLAACRLRLAQLQPARRQRPEPPDR